MGSSNSGKETAANAKQRPVYQSPRLPAPLRSFTVPISPKLGSPQAASHKEQAATATKSGTDAPHPSLIQDILQKLKRGCNQSSVDPSPTDTPTPEANGTTTMKSLPVCGQSATSQVSRPGRQDGVLPPLAQICQAGRRHSRVVQHSRRWPAAILHSTDSTWIQLIDVLHSPGSLKAQRRQH